MNEMNEWWFSGIANVGFPITVSIYLLIRFEKKIEGLKNSIDKLGDAINEYMMRR